MSLLSTELVAPPFSRSLREGGDFDFLARPLRFGRYAGGSSIPFSKCLVTCEYEAACGSCVTITIVF